MKGLRENSSLNKSFSETKKNTGDIQLLMEWCRSFADINDYKSISLKNFNKK